VLLSRNKKAAGSPEPRLGEKQKSRGPSGARGSHLVMVDPSQTQSSSPGAYYYDEYENKAANQRPMDHVHSLSMFNGGDIFILRQKHCQGDFYRGSSWISIQGATLPPAPAAHYSSCDPQNATSNENTGFQTVINNMIPLIVMI